MTQGLEYIALKVKSRESGYICCVPIHLIIDSAQNLDVNVALLNSNLNAPDGMGVVWILKLIGYKNVSRVYGPDLLLKTCKKYPNFRHYFLGGTNETNEILRKNLLKEIPNLTIAGHNSQEISIDKIQAPWDLRDVITLTNPDIIWVALGSPKQELWMYENQKHFPDCLLIGVGAAFDFLSGNKPQAPRWVQRSGFEWLFRLLSEPHRLWKRYLLGYPNFIYLLIKHHVFKVPFNA